MTAEPPEVTDVELSREPPFVGLTKRTETREDWLKGVILGTVALLVAVVYAVQQTEPNAIALVLISALGGAIIGSSLKSLAVYGD